MGLQFSMYPRPYWNPSQWFVLGVSHHMCTINQTTHWPCDTCSLRPLLLSLITKAWSSATTTHQKCCQCCQYPLRVPDLPLMTAKAGFVDAGAQRVKGTDVCAAGCGAQDLLIRSALASANWMFCQCHWSLPMWAPSPSAGAQCWGHQCLKYSTIPACWWSCRGQLCWLLLFPMSPKCFMRQLFYWGFFFLRLIHGS